MYKDRKIILMSPGGCGDAYLGGKAFNKLGYGAIYTANADYVEFADLIILPGGADVDYTRYDGNIKLCGKPSLTMEKFDSLVLPIALEREIPIFGICRGHQTLWVELGGKLDEDVYPMHPHIHSVFGEWGEVVVNSLHHQAPKYPVPNTDVAVHMKAPDGTIEAFTYSNFAVAVQWHPEMMSSSLWLHLILAAIEKQADLIPKMYGLRKLNDTRNK